ncbi:MAG: VIT domain-containing protein, partial [Planctomycetaceae bacterium]
LQVYRTAHGKPMDGVTADLHAFAFVYLPEFIHEATDNYSNILSQTAQTLRDLNGPLEGLAFLVERIEKEPAWVSYTNQDSWNQHAWQLAQWRFEAQQIGALEPRLLKIVLAELRRDLVLREARNNSIYYSHSSYFWSEKTADFARVAEAVLKERSDSEAAAKYIAEYFYHGLRRWDRGIDILFAFHRRGLLHDDGQSQLVGYLHARNRHGESVPLLIGLIERNPDQIGYRLQLMHAYFETDQTQKLLALLKETDTHFHEGGRWTEPNIAALAASCLSNELYTESAAYYEELIPLHQRTQPNRGIGNGTLSNYYADLAQAYSALGKTADAVDAAAGAIVSWGADDDNRRHALESLTGVLRNAR